VVELTSNIAEGDILAIATPIPTWAEVTIETSAKKENSNFFICFAIDFFDNISDIKESLLFVVLFACYFTSTSNLFPTKYEKIKKKVFHFFLVRNVE
jgi:hypothetical protein